MDILEELAEARRLDAEARAKRVPPGEMERLARAAPPARPRRSIRTAALASRTPRHRQRLFQL